MFKKIITVLSAVLFCLSTIACSVNSNIETNDKSGIVKMEESETVIDSTIFDLSGIDSLGRKVEPIGGWKDNSVVGVFYFLWLGQGKRQTYSLDISKMSKSELLSDCNIHDFHYWGEPLYGYYDSRDTWVFRKHMELFSAAGVDYIAFDTTNAYYYPEVLDVIFPVALEMIKGGCRIPKFLFYCNTKTKTTVETIYNKYYDLKTEIGQKYSCLWFKGLDTNETNVDKKPWIIGRNNDKNIDENFDCLPEEIKNSFYFKSAQWPNEALVDDGFPWMSWTPKAIGRKQYNHNGIMSVSVAQHISGAFSDSVDSGQLNYGRGYSIESGNAENGIMSGANFQEQWDNVFSLGNFVQNVFVTGWNEWIAQKQPISDIRSVPYFVDQYNMEYSRDIEMMKGGYGDNYYMQLVQNIRKFKGKEFTYTAPLSRTVEVSGDKSQFNGCKSYMDFDGDLSVRNYTSAGGSHGIYTNTTGRNDIKEVQVTYDAKNIYFYVECADKITQYNDQDKNWMNILLSVDGQGDWEHYGYVINREFENGKTVVGRLNQDGSYNKVGLGEFCVQGNYMIVSVPKNAIGIAGDSFALEFKVADNVTNYTDIIDYYVNGDVAPIGRLNYSFIVKK